MGKNFNKYKRNSLFRSRDSKSSDKVPKLCERCGEYILISCLANAKCSIAAHQGSAKCKQMTSLRATTSTSILTSFQRENDYLDTETDELDQDNHFQFERMLPYDAVDVIEQNQIMNENLSLDVYIFQQAIHRSMQELNEYVKIKKSSNANGKASTEDTLDLFNLKLQLGLSHKEMNEILDCFNGIIHRNDVAKELTLPRKSETIQEQVSRNIVGLSSSCNNNQKQGGNGLPNNRNLRFVTSEPQEGPLFPFTL